MAAGREIVSAIFVIPYPPGFPILVPGQVVSSDILDFLRPARCGRDPRVRPRGRAVGCSPTRRCGTPGAISDHSTWTRTPSGSHSSDEASQVDFVTVKGSRPRPTGRFRSPLGFENGSAQAKPLPPAAAPPESLNLDEDLDVDQTAASLGLTSSRHTVGGRSGPFVWSTRARALGDRLDRAGRVRQTERWSVSSCWGVDPYLPTGSVTRPRWRTPPREYG